MSKKKSAPKSAPKAVYKEIGMKGYKHSGGYVQEEFLSQLSGDRGRRTYRQMRDNDSVIGSFLFAIEMLFGASSWTVSSPLEGPQGEKDIEFLESVIFHDMDHSWGDVINQVQSMFTYGWQLSEVTYKRRIGPFETNPARRSNYTDGKIGIRRIADRGQETLLRWDIDEYSGDVLGMYQQPPMGGPVRYIPMEKALLFRPHLHKGSPEGRSILRNAYRPWYLLNGLQEIESIACERELTGMPVVKIPGAMLASDDATVVQQVAEFTKMARDLKLNHQAGCVIPSDPYYDAQGKPTNLPQVSVELLAVKGGRTIDIDKAIRRYQTDISRTVMADFVMLGQNDRGSFAMSRSKIDLFAWSLECWLRGIADTVNRHLVHKLWAMNGFPMENIPYLVPGRVAPEDLTELGSYIESLSRAGINVLDLSTEDHLRRAGGLPEAPVDSAERRSTIPVEPDLEKPEPKPDPKENKDD
jgi:hypothetical protein